MKKENWQKAFSEIPEDYNRRLNGTLNSLTETPERRFMHKPILVLAAALVLILGIAAEGQLNALIDDSALLVNAAAQGGLALGNDLFRDGKGVFRGQLIFKGETCDLAQHLVFQFLNVGIKQRHEHTSHIE